MFVTPPQDMTPKSSPERVFGWGMFWCIPCRIGKNPTAFSHAITDHSWIELRYHFATINAVFLGLTTLLCLAVQGIRDFTSYDLIITQLEHTFIAGVGSSRVRFQYPRLQNGGVSSEASSLNKPSTLPNAKLFRLSPTAHDKCGCNRLSSRSDVWDHSLSALHTTVSCSWFSCPLVNLLCLIVQQALSDLSDYRKSIFRDMYAYCFHRLCACVHIFLSSYPFCLIAIISSLGLSAHAAFWFWL